MEINNDQYKIIIKCSCGEKIDKVVSVGPCILTENDNKIENISFVTCEKCQRSYKTKTFISIEKI